MLAIQFKNSNNVFQKYSNYLLLKQLYIYFNNKKEQNESTLYGHDDNGCY